MKLNGIINITVIKIFILLFMQNLSYESFSDHKSKQTKTQTPKNKSKASGP